MRTGKDADRDAEVATGLGRDRVPPCSRARDGSATGCRPQGFLRQRALAEDNAVGQGESLVRWGVCEEDGVERLEGEAGGDGVQRRGDVDRGLLGRYARTEDGDTDGHGEEGEGQEGWGEQRSMARGLEAGSA